MGKQTKTKAIADTIKIVSAEKWSIEKNRLMAERIGASVEKDNTKNGREFKRIVRALAKM